MRLISLAGLLAVLVGPSVAPQWFRLALWVRQEFRVNHAVELVRLGGVRFVSQVA